MEATHVAVKAPNWRLFAKLVPALALLALVIPSSAFGQATRTWVSGTGSDANPCARSSPCQTFAGAISKTAAGGEINVLDPGAYGAVTITKSITIDAGHKHAGVLGFAGVNGIIVNAASTDKVKLKNLDINGAGTGPQSALVGVKVISAKAVNIKNSEIYRWKSGINVVPTSPVTRVRVAHNNIHDNGVGVIVAPGSAAADSTTVTMKHNDVFENTCGAAVSSFGANANPPDPNTNCGTSGDVGLNEIARLRAYHNGFNDNDQGLLARGHPEALLEIAYNEISGNTIWGIHRMGSAIVRTFSPGTNVITDNPNSSAPSETVPLQ